MSFSFIRSLLKGSHEYQPLAERLDIRLLTVLPGKWESPMKCKLRHVSLQDCPEYEALSYVWGDPTNKKSISLDNHVFEVTRNLDAALRSIRNEHGHRVLWVDAICIDQENINERNRQVRIMWRIYEQARVVLAWLGNDEEQSEEAMAIILKAGVYIRSQREDESSARPNWLDDLNEESFKALWRLLQRPYWTRIWIIQEQYFSGDLQEQDQDRCLVGCGRQWISRLHLTGALEFLQIVGEATGGISMNFDGHRTDETYRQARLLMFDESPAIQMFETIKIAKYLQETASSTDQLSVMMHKTRHFEATDPMDMVFALLGLLREGNTAFTIDYLKSIYYILKEVVQFTITRDQNLIILQGNRNGDRGNGPSWLPHPRYFLRSTKPWDRRSLYKASKGLLAEKPRLDNYNYILFIHGVGIGTVSTRIGPFWQLSTLAMTEWSGGAEHPGTLLKEYSKSLNTDRREDFWRTLVLDQETVVNSVRHPAPDELANMYEVLINDAPIPEDFEPEMREQGNTFGRRYLYTHRFVNNLSMCGGQRCFFETDTGYMGMGPYCTEPGDLVVVLRGSSLPFVLRPIGDHQELVGDAYVHGAMNGELINLDERGNLLNAQEFGLR